MSAPTPVCGVVARTERGRRLLRAGASKAIPSTFPPASRAWWSDKEAGVALHRPDAQVGQPASVLAVAGVLYRDHRIDTHRRERPTDDTALAEELLRKGDSALAKLRGDFTLALWDGNRQRLTLARDALGQRNMFVRSGEDFHVFSSELLPLLDDPDSSCELDFASAYHYLACGLPAPGQTMARGIRRIPAGHLIAWEPDRPFVTYRYWTPLHDEPRADGNDATRTAIAKALDASIEARLEPNRSQALLLSGGLDSSFIAATAASKVGGSRLEAYTVEFDPSYGKNETEYARLVTDTFAIRHHALPLSARDAVPLCRETLEAAEPCSAWTTMTHRHLLRAMRADGHVHMLSGLGADEVFAGYSRLLNFYVRWHKHHASYRGAKDIDSFEALLWDRERGREILYPGVASFFDDAQLRRSVQPAYRGFHYATHLEEFYRECRRIRPEAHPFEMMVAHECQRRIPDLLFVDFEPVSRELGIRTAYPFLDPGLLTLVCGLGAESRYKYKAGIWWNKMMLRGIAAERVPRPIIDRSPYSYTAPFAHWMREPAFAKPALARLRGSRFWKAGLVRPDLLDRVLGAMEREPLSRRGTVTPWVNQAWILLTLVGWYDRYVERRT